MPRPLAAALAVSTALALGACGGDEELTATVTTPATEPTATAAPTVSTETGTETAPAQATEPTATTGVPSTETGASGGVTAPAEEQAGEGGAGDEEVARTPAAFEIDGESVTPASVAVPAFLAIELRLTSRDGRAHEVVVELPDPVRVTVEPGATATRQIPGARAGSYPVRVDGRARAQLAVGAEGGP